MWGSDLNQNTQIGDDNDDLRRLKIMKNHENHGKSAYHFTMLH
jgi:hypothetical protein